MTTERTPTTITYDSVLSQDFVTSDQVIVDGSRAGQVAVFRNPHKGGAVEALVVTRDSELWYLAHDPGSLTGWSLTRPFGDSNPTYVFEVIAFTTTWGAVDTFFVTTGGHFSHSYIDATTGQWTKPTVVAGAPLSLSQLGVTFTPGATASSGALAVYALAPKGKFFLYRGVAGSWAAGSWDLGGSATSWKVTLHDASSWMLIMVAAEDFTVKNTGFIGLFGDKVKNGQIAWCWGQISDKGLTDVSLKIDDVHETDRIFSATMHTAGSGAMMLLFLGGDHATNTPGPISAMLNPGTVAQNYGTLAGPTFVDATVATSSRATVDIFAIDADMNLFAIRQIGLDPQNMSAGYGDGQTFGPILQIDARIRRMYPGLSPGDAPTLIAVDGDIGALHLYVEDPNTHLWLVIPIRLPSSSSVELTRFRTEINVYDQNGQLMPAATLELAASSAVDIEYNGQFQVVDSSRHLTVMTNTLGKATFSSLATSLAAPAFTIAAAGLPTQAPHSPSSPVNAYLAGNGALYGKPAFNADAVKQIAPSSQVDAATAHSAIQKVAQMGQQGPTLRALADSPTPVHVFATVSGQATFRACATRAEADAFVRTSLGATNFWGNVWDSAGDVWRAIGRGMHKVTCVVVDATRSVVQMVVRIGDSLVQLADLVIQSVEDAMHALAGVLSWIGAELEKAIDWLKNLFDFKAIWNTKEALKTRVLGLSGYVKGQAQEWGDQIGQAISHWKASVDANFARAASDSRAMKQLDGWPGMGKPPSATKSLAGSATPNDIAGNTSANWMLEKVSSNVPGEINGVSEPDGEPFHNFIQSVLAVYHDVLSIFDTLFQGLVKLLNVNNVDSFEDIAVGTLLQLLKESADAAFDIANSFIQGILGLLAFAMDSLATLLTTSLDLGFLNRVYGWIARAAGGSPEMTLVDLVALVAAFPVTIVYKLIEGVDAEPFPGGELPLTATMALGAPHPLVRRIFATVAGTISSLNALITAGSDIVGNQTPIWVSLISVGLSAIRQAFTHPSVILSGISSLGDWAPLVFSVSAVAALAAVEWAVSSSKLVLKIAEAAGALGKQLTSWLEEILRSYSGLANVVLGDVTKLASSVIGFFLLVYTAASDALDPPPPVKFASDLLEGVVMPFSFLTMTPIRDAEPYGELAVMLKLAIDVLAGVGGGALEIASAWVDIPRAAPPSSAA